MSALGSKIAELRAARRMTYRTVGEIAGVTGTCIFDIEHGRSINPTVATLLGIAHALDVNPHVLAALAFADQPGVRTICHESYGSANPRPMAVTQ